MTDPLHTEPVEVTRDMMERAADLAERFYLADFGGNDVAALRHGIIGDSAIRDFVFQVEAVRTAAEVASRAREARLREALERIAGQHGPYSHPFPEGGEGYAAWAVMEARTALTASEGGDHG